MQGVPDISKLLQPCVQRRPWLLACVLSSLLLALACALPLGAAAASQRGTVKSTSASAWGWSTSSRSWARSEGVLPASVVRRGPKATITRGQFLNALLKVEAMRAANADFGWGQRAPRRLLESTKPAPALPDARAGSARARAIANGWMTKRNGRFAPGAKITADEAALATAGMLGLHADVNALARRLRSSVPGQRGVGTRAAAAHALVRTVGLRYNVEAPHDRYELGPRDAVNVAHGSYMLHVAAEGISSWKLDEARTLAATFELPKLGPNQRRIIGTAMRQLGQPYIWAGETEHQQPEGKGGFDCSGFAIRVINDAGVPAGRLLRINERTSYTQSAIPRKQRITEAKLRPGDAMFFGERGPRSKPAENYHVGVYMGNGWFIHSSGGNGGVAINRLDGYWGEHFAWGRRALRGT